ncbi:retrotransposon protein, putative, ty1-copia subclass [Tanacetum coccineum]
MLPVVCKNCRLTPQLHESAGDLPSLKLSLHSCSLPGSTNAMGIETSIALVLPAREHECDTSFVLGRPPALSSMFEISGNNFNDWFRQLKMVLRVERKLFVIEQPISLASPTDSEYLRSGMRMRENQLAHMSLDEELCGTGTSWLCAPTRAYKKAYIPKPKNPKPSAKEHPAKDDACHHCKEVGHCKRNCPAYLAELIKKKKQVGTASSLNIFVIELFYFPTKSWVSLHLQTRQSERRSRTLLDIVRSIMNLTTLPLSFWDYALEFVACILNMVLTKKVDKTPYEL